MSEFSYEHSDELLFSPIPFIYAHVHWHRYELAMIMEWDLESGIFQR